jgi:hypothetical protein
MLRFAVGSVVALTIVTSACAQERSGPAYEAAMKGAMMVMSFDALAAKCAAKGGFAASDAAAIKQWARAQRADAMRARTERLRADATNRAHLDQAVNAVVTMIDQREADPCMAAVRLTGSEEARFATLLPDLAPTGTASGAKQRATPVTAGPASPLIAQIDSFGFDSRAAMGFGGFMTTDIYPVVLFRDGRALTDVTGLSDIAASRQAHPEDWTQWRRSGSEIQFLKKGGWERIAFRKTYASLPPGFRLNGLFRRLSGTGNIGVGGSDSVTLVRDYRFWPDGTVLHGSVASASASTGESSVVTRSAPPDARGHYRIDGLTLAISYDNGASERRMIVADPADPKTAIWLDGEGYTQER